MKKIIIIVIILIAVITAIFIYKSNNETKKEKKPTKQVVKQENNENVEGKEETLTEEKQIKVPKNKTLEESAWVRYADGELVETYLFQENGTCSINGEEGTYEVEKDRIKLELEGIKLDYSYENNGGNTIKINGLTYKRLEYGE